MKSRKSLLTILAGAWITATSIQGFAAPQTTPIARSVQLQEQDLDIWGYPLSIDFNTFVYILFVVQTNDTASPADVNDLPIVSNYEDDPNGFYRVLYWLP